VASALEGEDGMEEFPAFRERLESSGRALFIADNCGEVVFDRVLIETMVDVAGTEVTLAVRGGPIINDVTVLEARELGLDELCQVISSGMRMPGTVPEKANPRVQAGVRGLRHGHIQGPGQLGDAGGVRTGDLFHAPGQVRGGGPREPRRAGGAAAYQDGRAHIRPDAEGLTSRRPGAP
jgi:hypothetical protein